MLWKHDCLERRKYRLKNLFKYLLHPLRWWFRASTRLCLFFLSDRGDRFCFLTANMRTSWRTVGCKETMTASATGIERTSYLHTITYRYTIYLHQSRPVSTHARLFTPARLKSVFSRASVNGSDACFWNVGQIRNEFFFYVFIDTQVCSQPLSQFVSFCWL